VILIKRWKYPFKLTGGCLNQWTKGLLAEALETVAKRRCSSLQIINAAYTSQMDSFNGGLLTGLRKNDKFYRENVGGCAGRL